jgi:hypothetical protein
MSTTFDHEVTITHVKRFTSFTIININIKLNEPARIDVILEGLDRHFENIEIPVETYTMWQFDQEALLEYCKTFLQNKYA